MIRKSTILAVPAALAFALVGACSGDRDQDTAEVERSREADQVPATAPASGQADAYGRQPGDPHYGHNHPPADQAPATAPASGQADAYGRQPGDPHYGHNHP